MALVEGDPDALGKWYDTENYMRSPRPLTKLEYLSTEPLCWVVGVDLANSVDRTAIVILEVHRGWAVTNVYAMWQDPKQASRKRAARACITWSVT